MRRAIILTVLALVAGSALPMATASADHARAPASDPWSTSPDQTARLGSDDPIATAVAVSRVRFAADGAVHVVLTRDDAFPDALAGTPLASEGPLLVTDKDVLDPRVRTELDRALADGGRVYLLGGPNAMAPAIEDQLRAAGYDVVRLAGTNRILTAIEIAEEVTALYPENAGRVLIARSRGTETNPTAGFADSVTGGGFAADARIAVVLSDTAALNAETAAYLDGRAEGILLGGPGALSPDVEAAVRARTSTTRRVSGTARDLTAVQIARELWERPAGFGRYTLINGYAPNAYLFGLPAAGLAADFDAPLLAVGNDAVPGGTVSALTTDDCALDTLVIGGPATVGDVVRTDVEARDGTRPCIGDGTLTIGTLFPRSAAPGLAANFDAAIQLAIDDLGSSLPGLRIELLPGDTQGDQGVGGTEVRRLASAGAEAFIGPAFSSVANGIIDDLAAVGVPACSPTASLASLSSAEAEEPGWFHRVAPPDRLQAAAMLKHAADLGHQQVSVIVQEQFATEQYEADLNDQAATFGVTVTYSVSSDSGPWDDDVAAAMSSGATAHLVVAWQPESREIVDALLGAGVAPRDIVGHEGLFDPSLATAGVDGMTGTAFREGGFGDWSTRFEASAPDGAEDVLAAHAYDCLSIVVLAAVSADSDDPEAIRHEMVGVTRDGTACSTLVDCVGLAKAGTNIDHDGVTGRGEWDLSGEPTEGSYSLWEFDSAFADSVAPVGVIEVP